MSSFNALLLQLLAITLKFCVLVSSGHESWDPVLYYYGLEESERSLPMCESRQACSAYIQRYWRPAAIVRLCRCPRRARCDSRADPSHTIPWNNRALFQFCHPVQDWPVCAAGAISESHLTVVTTYDRINPDELERLHHKNIHLVPPKIVFNCRCPEPNYWMLLSNSTNSDNAQLYQCKSLLVCQTGQSCGNVTYDMYALYQSCLCAKRNMCVHNGGITQLHITELLYRGKGWRAYCQKISAEDYSYEDY